MTARDLSLAGCAAQFGKVLEKCEITARDGAGLDLEHGMTTVLKLLANVRNSKGSVYVIGNGGSAGVASHAVVDLVNVGKMRAYALHEPALITCMANDYGYENAFAQMLKDMARAGDALIAISSSGNSKNIRNAALQVAQNGGTVITLSGFAANNPLRSLGDINIWLGSMDYGMVEIGHQFILHNLSDRFGAGHETGNNP